MKPCGQRLGDELLIGADTLHVGRLRVDVDRDDAVEAADVEARRVVALARAEQVGRLLGQAYAVSGRYPSVGRQQPVNGFPVGLPTFHVIRLDLGWDTARRRSP